MSALAKLRRAAPSAALALAGCVSTTPAKLAIEQRAPAAAALEPCSDFERDVERVWNVQRKAEISAAFVKLGVDYADRVVERVTTKMDDITSDWVMLSEKLCKDYLVRKAITQREYVAAAACFDAALIRQRTFARMLAAPNKSYAARALDAFEEISNKLDECRHAATITLYAEDAAIPATQRDAIEALTSEAILAAKLDDATRAERAAGDARTAALAAGSGRAELDTLLASAFVEIQQVKLASARQLLNQAIDSATRLGARLQLALAYQRLGQLHDAAHDYDAAIAAYERALALRRELLPPGHPLIAWILDNIGAASHARGDDRRAIALHTQALELYGIRSDEDRPAVADALNNLGLAWQSFDRERAIAYFARALEIDRPSPRDDRPCVADTLNNLGLAYREGAEFSRAIDALTRALAIYRAAAFPAQHPHVLRALRNLGKAYLQAQDYAQAIETLAPATAVSDPSAARDDPGLVLALDDLASAYGQSGDYGRAAERLEQALALRLRAEPIDEQQIADSYSNLGVALLQAGQAGRALAPLQAALERNRRVRGNRDSRMVDALENLGFAWHALGDCERARELWRQACALCEQLFGADNAHTMHLRAALARPCTPAKRAENR